MLPMNKKAIPLLTLSLILAIVAVGTAQEMAPAPDRGGQGDGPFERLIIRGVTIIDGTGGPPVGPADIVIEGNRIAEIRSVGAPGVPIDEEGRPKGATKELDAEGMYILPGFVDAHVHCGGYPKTPEVEYVYKLWMAHGITTVRGVPCGPMGGPIEWDLLETLLRTLDAVSR